MQFSLVIITIFSSTTLAYSIAFIATGIPLAVTISQLQSTTLADYLVFPSPPLGVDKVIKVIFDSHLPHWKTAAPQVNPAPKPEAAITSPVEILPSRTASSKAIGMEAALVLP